MLHCKLRQACSAWDHGSLRVAFKVYLPSRGHRTWPESDLHGMPSYYRVLIASKSSIMEIVTENLYSNTPKGGPRYNAPQVCIEVHARRCCVQHDMLP